MARKTIKQLEAELAKAQAQSTSNYEIGRDWKAKAERAEEALKESRSHFADLKERLANAEAEQARQRGYMERVREDDLVRDGVLEIDGPDGKHIVPKRNPVPRLNTSGMSDFELDQFGARKKRTHWTSY